MLRRRGHHDPASVVLLGMSTPVRGCARFSRPLGELEAIEIAAESGVARNAHDERAAAAAVPAVPWIARGSVAR